ncbi:hypothetical protein B0H14DRAFT_3436207 [Mycena olivaceomarginata]|nr:hypothetical protein B0H14DRAFT_3436207 [Mycena olivaceomarginata]
MAGECDSPNLKEVLNLFIDNRGNMGLFSTFFHKTHKAFSMLQHFRCHSHARSIANVAGYDTSNEIYAAAELGCSVDTLTLSVEQKQLAEKRIEEPGFSAQIRVHFMDYRDMPAYFKGVFYTCVSIAMLEASGSMEEGLGKCSNKLA